MRSSKSTTYGSLTVTDRCSIGSLPPLNFRLRYPSLPARIVLGYCTPIFVSPTLALSVPVSSVNLNAPTSKNATSTTITIELPARRSRYWSPEMTSSKGEDDTCASSRRMVEPSFTSQRRTQHLPRMCLNVLAVGEAQLPDGDPLCWF